MKQLIFLVAFVLTSFLVGPKIFAQNSQNQPTDSYVVTSTPEPADNAVVATVPNPGMLASLPEADTLIYINAKRILNEAVPHFVPATEVAKMRQQFNDLKHLVGLDPSQIDYLVLAVRFRQPSSELNFVPPEFMLVASGDFSADALLEVVRLAAGEALREETYGQKNLTLFAIDPILKEAEKHDILKSYAEIAIVSLDDGRIGIGTTRYVKAALDAEQGEGRINPAILNSLMRDPQVLLSIAGTPLNAFSKSLGLLGVEGTPRSDACASHFGDFYAAVTMDQTHFKLQGAMNADNPNTAKIINGLLSSLTQQAISTFKDASAQSILTNLALTAEGHEVLLRADLSQQALLNFINEQMKPRQTEVKPVVKTPVKKQKARTPRRSRRG